MKIFQLVQLSGVILLFCACQNNNIHIEERVLWNMETNKGYISEIIDNSHVNNFFTYLQGATDDAFVCQIPAYEFILADWEENESAKKAAKETLKDDNPVIAFYYFD